MPAEPKAKAGGGADLSGQPADAGAGAAAVPAKTDDATDTTVPAVSDNDLLGGAGDPFGMRAENKPATEPAAEPADAAKPEPADEDDDPFADDPADQGEADAGKAKDAEANDAKAKGDESDPFADDDPFS